MRFYILILLLFIFIPFGGKAQKTEKPVAGQNVFLQSQISAINLPLEIKVATLEALLNKQITGLIYEDNSYDDNGGDNMMVKAWKKENIKLDFVNGQFTYRVPLKLWIKAGWKINQFGLNLSDYREMNAEIALSFHTSITINKDWTVTTTTVSDGYEWLSTPVLKVGPVDVPITMIATTIVRANRETIAAAIDKGVKKSLDLKSNVRTAWVQMQQPLLLSDEYGLWLRITPKEIYASPITGGKGIVRYTSMVKGVADVFTGQKPPVFVNSNLPELKPLANTSEGFQANVNSYISYHYIDSVTRKIMQNSTYEFGKKKITITDIEIKGDENAMTIIADVKGSLKGKLFFTGQPAYRAADSSIVLKDLQFHIDTKNFLVKTAAWLANSGIEKMMSKKMNYPVGENIRETYKTIQESIKYYEIGQGFYMEGVLDGIEVMQPGLVPEGIIAPVSVKGKVSIKTKD